MKIAIGSDSAGLELKEHLKTYLKDMSFDVMDLTMDKDCDLFEATTNVTEAINNNEAERGIVIDEYGVAPFMIANKHKGMICANVSDEHSAKMTVRHNGAFMITIGSGIVGVRLAEKICETFLKTDYDGGRHQIRVDMLNKMC